MRNSIAVIKKCNKNKYKNTAYMYNTVLVLLNQNHSLLILTTLNFVKFKVMS